MAEKELRVVLPDDYKEPRRFNAWRLFPEDEKTFVLQACRQSQANSDSMRAVGFGRQRYQASSSNRRLSVYAKRPVKSA